MDYHLFVQSKPGYDAMGHMVPSFTSFYQKCSAKRDGFVGDAFSYVAGSAGNAFAWLLLHASGYLRRSKHHLSSVSN